MSDLVLRPARLADVGAVLDLWAVAAENDDRPVDTADAVRRLVDRDPDALVLALLGERVVGTLASGWDGWRAHLYRLAVAPDVRRRGVARLLLEHAERRLQALGATRIDAMVLDANAAGHALWVAAGYRRQPGWSRWVTPPG